MASFANSTPAPEILHGGAALHQFPHTCPTGVDPAQWLVAVQDRIEAHLQAVDALMATLDGQTPDADFEDDGTAEPILGWPDGALGRGAIGNFEGSDDREDVNEDGGDIQDNPHDDQDEGNDEPDLGRLETLHQYTATYGGDDPLTNKTDIIWQQDGYSTGNQMLRERGLPTLRGVPGLWW